MVNAVRRGLPPAHGAQALVRAGFSLGETLHATSRALSLTRAVVGSPVKTAARVSLSLLLAQGLSVQHVLPPPGDDPASFLRHEGAQALHRLQTYDTLLEHLTPAVSPPDSPAESASRMSDALRLLSCIPNPTLRIAYAQHAAKRLGLPSEILLRLLVPDLARRE